MVSLDELMDHFAALLCASGEQLAYFSSLDAFSPDPPGAVLSDWLQFNWELLIEGALFRDQPECFLQIYGDGADFFEDASSRLLLREALPTHAVYVVPKAGSDLVDLMSSQRLECPEPGWQFDRFVSMDGTWYFERPPFDCVLVYPETHVVFARSELRFVLAPLVDEE